MPRGDVAVARCAVKRLMSRLGLQGMGRGKGVRTKVPDAMAACPLDRVDLQFKCDARANCGSWTSAYIST